MDETATITKKFSQSFDSTNETHVKWFKLLHDSTQNEKNVEKVMMENPFGIRPTKKEILEWIHIQFILGLKYSVAVLNGAAWIPGTQKA